MPDYELGDAPNEDAYREMMEATALALDDLFNGDVPKSERKTGFVLMVFPFGKDAEGRCNYISNGADREDIVVLMKE